MKKTLQTLLSAMLTAFVTLSANAADFRPQANMTNIELDSAKRRLYGLLNGIKNKASLDVLSTSATKVIPATRDERPESFVSQYNCKYSGLWCTDGESTDRINHVNAQELISLVVNNKYGVDVSNLDQDQQPSARTLQTLAEVFQSLMGKNYEFFEAIHSNENGTWNIVNVYDPANQEILSIQFGLKGT